MSLPPTVRFDYNYQPAKGSEENKLLQACLNPVDWINSPNNIEEDEWSKKVNTC